VTSLGDNEQGVRLQRLCRFCRRLAVQDTGLGCPRHRQVFGHFPTEVRWRQAPNGSPDGTSPSPQQAGGRCSNLSVSPSQLGSMILLRSPVAGTEGRRKKPGLVTPGLGFLGAADVKPRQSRELSLCESVYDSVPPGKLYGCVCWDILCLERITFAGTGD
jgi:hypothetical protein